MKEKYSKSYYALLPKTMKVKYLRIKTVTEAFTA